MAPHAVENPPKQDGSVNSVNGSKKSVNSLSQGGASLFGAGASPFGVVSDPKEIGDESYVSPLLLIEQTIYSILSKIFSYESVGADNLLDSRLQLWAQHYERTNAIGVVPFFHRFQVRSGASNAILGFLGKNGTHGQPLSVVASGNALKYMQPVLSNKSAQLPLSFNIANVNYDCQQQTLFSDYNSSLSVARALRYPVLSAVDINDGEEVQHMTVLNHYIATLTGSPCVHLFDGLESHGLSAKFTNLNSSEKLAGLYQTLLSLSTNDITSTEKAVEFALASLNRLTGKSYSQFEYVGSNCPEVVLVTHGSNKGAQLSNVVKKLRDLRIGLVMIRVPTPFNAAKFAGVIPFSTRRLVVLGQNGGNSGVKAPYLKADISAALFLLGDYHRFSIEDFSYPVDFVWTPITIVKVLSEYLHLLNPEKALVKANPSPLPIPITANTCPSGKYLVWGRDNSFVMELANKLALSLSLDDSKKVAIRNKFDNIHGGGTFQTQIESVSLKDSFAAVDSADLVLVEDISLFSCFDILATASPGGTILLINHKPIKNSIEEDVIPKLPFEVRKTLAVNQNRLVLVDLSIEEELESSNDSTKGFTADFLVQTAFWRYAFPELGGYLVNKLLQANGNGFELLASVLDKFVADVDLKKGIKEVVVAPEWADLKPEPEAQETNEAAPMEVEAKEEKEVQEGDTDEPEQEILPFFPLETSLFPNPRLEPAGLEESLHSGYKSLATRFTFPEAFETKHDLRPDLSVKNFVVKVQENKRLTPSEYSRNIFHIEFDISNTGLRYDIGEALGVHGRNNSEDVESFLQFYEVDGNSLVEVTNKDDPSIFEVKSARQALQDTVDFLGKPPKRFYESLSAYAADEKQKQHLEKLASAAGAEELKKRQEVDFSTYVDILEEFDSARPTFTELIKIIAPLKRREYSIASSQKIHPNAVHLLIVVVDWVDPKGRTRYGHCSKYLSDLSIGDELVVSVKPSVMKLPPLSTQPIIMSGLGTGLAPFKAFIEEKIWQKQQGMEIGEIYLYLGSRHKKEEYLYGELWEAYKDAGVLTHIGAAFSRDQPQKIYIQDRIRESIDELTDAFATKNGSFYLCGPTWPVPDITACLEDILKNAAKRSGSDLKDPAKAIEDLKEDGRYVLEVY